MSDDGFLSMKIFIDVFSLSDVPAVQPVDVFACFYRLCSLFTTIKGSKGLKELILVFQAKNKIKY